MNGTLTKVADGILELEAQFKSTGPAPRVETLHIRLQDVAAIEFNETVYNSGAPPLAIGITPLGATPKKPEIATDQLILKGGQHRDCKLIGIDQQLVHCAGKDGDYSRKISRRILVGVR